jgi:hypothetical protein
MAFSMDITLFPEEKSPFSAGPQPLQKATTENIPMNGMSFILDDAKRFAGRARFVPLSQVNIF